jgi:DHA2 family integral membrane protein (MFS transporter)
VARDSLGGALAVAERMNSPQLAGVAREAFVSGMHVAALVAAGVALLGAVVALVVLPGREHRPALSLDAESSSSRQ